MKIQHNQDGDILLHDLEQKGNRIARNSKFLDDQVNEKYLRIDKDYNFRAASKEYSEDKINDIIGEQKNYKITNLLAIEILDIIINCPYEDYFSYSLNMCKKLSINQKEIDNKLQNFYQINKTIFPKDLYLNNHNLASIGKLLSCSYSKFYKLKIKNQEKFEEMINNFKKTDKNIFTDYFLWCQKQGKDPDETQISLYIKKTKIKYELPPETIVLLNVYQNITKIILEIDKLDFPDFKGENNTYFELALLNLHWILNSLKDIKINLISKVLESSFFGTNRQKYEIECTKLNCRIKPINIVFDDIKHFNQRWDFTHKLKLYEKNNIINEKRDPWMQNSLFSKDINESNISYSVDIITKHQNAFELIFIIFFSLNLYNKDDINLELIINNCYVDEYSKLFDEVYRINILKNNSHIFNLMDLLLFNNIINSIDKMNIEINSLDNNSFKKLTSIIYYNELITNLNISFFSTDISYKSELLLKTYSDMFTNIESFRRELKKDYGEDTYLFGEAKEIEDKIIDNLYIKFADSLASFFECIKSKNNLNELGLNFEVPINLRKKSNYMNTILKFILNVLYFVSKQKIEKFCLISPYTVINPISNPTINILISSINFANNELVKELTLQMQFYQSSSIVSFLNSKLRILNIGNLDLSSFKVLCDYISKYDFCKKSSLENLTIGLLGSINEFTNEIKELFGKLFRIKINSLISLSILTEIHLEEEKEYLELLDLINYNWISKYLIKFDDNSKDIYTKEKGKILNLESLTTHFLEKKFYKNSNNFFGNSEGDFNDDAYWYLKYLFNYKYIPISKDNEKNSEKVKKLIYDILKYTHTKYNPGVSHTY